MDTASFTITTNKDKNFKKGMLSHLRKLRRGSLWIWIAILVGINLPLFWGEVRTSMLFFPVEVFDGQWWRVITYPMVHLSWYHLLLDASGFLILYSCLDEKRAHRIACYLIGPAIGSLALAITMDSAIFQRGLSGLSGIAHGLMAVSALEMMNHKHHRTWGILSLTIVVAKSTYELWSGQVVFEFMHMGMCGQPLAASHAGGVIGAIVTFLLMNISRSGRNIQKKSTITNHSAQRWLQTTAQTMLRMSVRLMARILYRVRYEGLHHIPNSGAAVLVCNHVSYVDWLIIAGACDRPVHFVVHAHIYRNPLLKWFLKLNQAIPINSARKNPAVLHIAFRKMTETLQSGGLLCIFPEGRLTRDGRIHQFRPGIEKIVQQTPVPVIPVALHGMWGSFFSHKNGPAMRRWPRKLRVHIGLIIGDHIHPHKVTAPVLHSAVKALHRGGPC